MFAVGISGVLGKAWVVRRHSSVRRFIITVLVATVLHAVALIIAPPFEFGNNRVECFFFGLIGGLWGFSLMFAILLLPLQWGLRRLMPQMRRAQAVLAGLVLLGLESAWVFTSPLLPHHHGFYVRWLFCSVFAIAVTISFFWPFGTDGRRSEYDHAV